jgi:integrase
VPLRVKDVDFQRREIRIRQGKGGKGRLTMLRLALISPLREQIAQSKLAYEEDRLHQRTGVMLPNALELKYPTAGAQWGWFRVFPSDHESTDPRSVIEINLIHLRLIAYGRTLSLDVRAFGTCQPMSSRLVPSTS